jgi:cell division cycle 2-like protein
MQSSKKRSRWSSDSSSDSEGGEEASASTAASLPMAVRSQAMLSSARPGEGESGSYTASHALGKTSSTIAEMLVSSVQADYTLAGQLLTSSCNASKSTVSNNTSYNSAIVGCRSVDNYERLNYISSGTYGDVFRARDISSGEIVALKQVKPNEQLESRQGRCWTSAKINRNSYLVLPAAVFTEIHRIS